MPDLQRETHPTVYEVIVGDAILPVVDGRETKGLLARVRSHVSGIVIRRRAVAALTTMFAPRGIRGHRGLDSSTTLVELEIHDHGEAAVATVHMTLWTGRRVQIAMYGNDGDGLCYSIAHLEGEIWMWSDPIRPRWLSDETAPDSRLVERLLAQPAKP